MTTSDFRNHIKRSCGFTSLLESEEQTRRFMRSETNRQGKPAWTVDQQGEDIGGNFDPDKVEANLDQWNDEERTFDGEDIENWQRRSEEQGAE